MSRIHTIDYAMDGANLADRVATADATGDDVVITLPLASRARLALIRRVDDSGNDVTGTPADGDTLTGGDVVVDGETSRLFVSNGESVWSVSEAIDVGTDSALAAILAADVPDLEVLWSAIAGMVLSTTLTGPAGADGEDGDDAVPAGASILLADITGIDLKATDDVTIYTVPAGKAMVFDGYAAQTDQDDMEENAHGNLGFTASDYADILSSGNVFNMRGDSLMAFVRPINDDVLTYHFGANTAQPVIPAGTVIKWHPTSAATSTANPVTGRFMLFGRLIDV